jgi:exodeoxyribonuclease VII small subunit
MSDVSNTETYEVLYTQLQEVVAQLEAGELPLEDLLRLYERGAQLAAQCQHLLDQAELRVQQLQSSDGIITSISMQIE